MRGKDEGSGTQRYAWGRLRSVVDDTDALLRDARFGETAGYEFGYGEEEIGSRVFEAGECAGLDGKCYAAGDDERPAERGDGPSVGAGVVGVDESGFRRADTAPGCFVGVESFRAETG